AGSIPSEALIWERLALAKTKPSAISAASATIRLRNAAKMIGGSGQTPSWDLKLATKARMSASGLPGMGRRMRDPYAKLKAAAGDFVNIGRSVGEFVDGRGIDRRDRRGEGDALGGESQPQALCHIAVLAGDRNSGKTAALDFARNLECGAPLPRRRDQ